MTNSPFGDFAIPIQLPPVDMDEIMPARSEQFKINSSRVKTPAHLPRQANAGWIVITPHPPLSPAGRGRRGRWCLADQILPARVKQFKINSFLVKITADMPGQAKPEPQVRQDSAPESTPGDRHVVALEAPFLAMTYR